MFKMELQTAVLCSLLALVACDDLKLPPEATITTGRVQGKWLQSREGRIIAAFEGIPYAAPPVGELRFKAPQPAHSWTDVLIAAKPGAACPQRLLRPGLKKVVGEEDCLFINVYTPGHRTHLNTSLDVMVFFHGGAFFMGSGAWFQPQYLLDHDVILVTFNYRLGALGFLSTRDEVIPGNAGLKDQVQALRWVKENIAALGGNPNSVLIFGESAGAASVHLLMLSPLAKGLFHKAVAQSGSALCPWALAPAEEPGWYAALLAEFLGCPAEPSHALRSCLLDKPAEDLVAVEYELLERRHLAVSFFKPVLETAGGSAGAFLTRHPRDILTSTGPESDVPLLTGFNTHEGSMWAVGIHSNHSAVKEFNDEFDTLLPMILNIRHLPEDLVKDSIERTRKFYYGDEVVSEKNKAKTIDLLTDFLFLWPAITTVELHVKHGKSSVFLYEFAHESKLSFSTFVVGSEQDGYGVCHSDDLFYLFPIDKMLSFKRELSEEDVQISKRFVEFFVNFASKGQPTHDGSWSRVVHPKAAEYLRINSPDDIRIRSNYAPERMGFRDALPLQNVQGFYVHDEL